MTRFPLVVLAGVILVGCGTPQPHGGQADPGTEGNGVEAQPEPYDVPEEALQRLASSPEGSVSDPAIFESSVYNGMRFQYWLYVPAQYHPGKPASLMVFQDGGTIYLDVFRTPVVFDNLIHSGEIPVTIGLFINPGTRAGVFQFGEDDEARSEQYDSIDETYTEFLLNEMIPEVVLSQFAVVDDPDGWAIAGFSSGGIAAFTVAWHRPDRFRKVLTHNGSFVDLRGGDAYPELIRSAEPKPLRVYLLSGTEDLDLPAGNWFTANNSMATVLEERGYAYRYRSGTGSHYPPMQGVSDFPMALRWLWRGYSLPQ